MGDHQLAVSTAAFGRLSEAAARTQRALEALGWTVVDVSSGWTTDPAFMAYAPPMPIVQLDASVTRGGGTDRFLVCGVLGEAPSSWHAEDWINWWAVGRSPQDPKAMVAMMLGVADEESAAKRLDERVTSSRDVMADLGAILGDPAALSVFALATAFVSGILNEGGKEVYSKLKSLAGRARNVRRLAGSPVNPWVVVHDPEHNCVIEFPKELPAQATQKLVRLKRDELTSVHLRWNPETEEWDRVQQGNA